MITEAAAKSVQQSIGGHLWVDSSATYWRGSRKGIAKAKAKKEAGRAAQQPTGQAKAAGIGGQGTGVTTTGGQAGAGN